MVLSELNEFLLRLNLKFQTAGGKPKVINKKLKNDKFDGAIWQKLFRHKIWIQNYLPFSAKVATTFLLSLYGTQSNAA
jgi:hypothetical protein